MIIISLTYDSQGRVLTLSKSTVLNVNYSYLAAPDKTIFYNGLADTNVYDVLMTAKYNTGPINITKKYLFDWVNNLLKSYTDGEGNLTTYIYDNHNNLTSIIYPAGDSIDYKRDAYENIIKITRNPVPGSAAGLAKSIISTSALYPSCTLTNLMLCHKPILTKDENGNETDYTYDLTTGSVTSVTSPAAAISGIRPQARYTYGSRYAYYIQANGGVPAQAPSAINELISISTCKTQAGAALNGTAGVGPFSLSGAAACATTIDETKTTIGYGPQTTGTANNLLPLTQTVAAGDGSISATTTTAYDVLGNAISVVGPLGQTTAYIYDPMQRVVGVISPNPSGAATGPNAAIRTTYDPGGRVIKQELGTTAGQTSSAWSGFTSLQKTESSYQDNFHFPNSSVLSGGGVAVLLTQYTYDGLDRLICTAARMNIAVYSTIQPSCLLSVQGNYSSDQITHYTYDGDNRITLEVDGYGSSVQASSITNSYNPNGTLKSVTDGGVNQTSYTYDGFDHLLKTQFPLGSGASAVASYESLVYYPGTDLPQTATLRDGSTLTLKYDNLNRVSTRSSSAGNIDTMSYDLLGRTASIASSATGQNISYIYDALGQLTRESQPYGIVNYGYAFTNTYSATSDYSTITWPDGYVATYLRDLAGNVTSIKMQAPAGVAATIATYSYDSLGRRIGVAFGNGTSRTYAYDAVSRLAGLQLSFPNASSVYNQLIGSVISTDGGTAIGYSPASQITSITRQNTAYSWANSYNVNRSYTPNALNQLTTSGLVALGYDLKGNLTTAATSSGSSTYSYDWLNRLTSSPNLNFSNVPVSLIYDPASRLVGYTTAATTNFIYAGASLIEETSPGNVLRRYVPGPGTDEPVVWYDGPDLSNPRYLQADERGSIVAVGYGGGNVTINTYDEFGIPGANNTGRFGYTGQTWYSEIGLYNYKARIYSPTLGRFMQADPIGYGDGLNMYNYAHSDPINGSDPLGLTADLTADNIENAVYAVTASQASSGDYGTLTTSGSYFSNQSSISSVDNSVIDLNQGFYNNSSTIYGVLNSTQSQQIGVNSPQSGGCGNHPILGAIGKIWSSPNSLLGLAAAGVSYAAGKFEGSNPSFQTGNNAIQLINSPLNVGNRAYTLGNVQVYGTGNGPSRGQTSYTGAFVNTGAHEEGHTVQGQILGVLYLPAWGLGRLFGGDSAGNPMEAGADRYGLGQSCSGF